MPTNYQFIHETEGNFCEEPSDRHFAVIGRFMLAFSGLEIAMVRTFRTALGVTEEIARALQSDGRPASSAKVLKRIFAVRYPDNQDDNKGRNEVLEQLLGDVAVLKVVRDNLAHRPFAYKGDRMVFFGFYTAKTFDWECEIYSIDDLRESAEYAELVGGTMQTLTEDFWKEAGPGLLRTLQRKPALLEHTRSRSSSKSRKPKRQPRPSKASPAH